MEDRTLTKALILEGTSRRDTVHLKEYDKDVVVRPLTDGELSKVFATIGNIGIREDGTPDIGSIDISRNIEALRVAASIGLVEPSLNLDEISKMKFGAPEFIGMKILELSGISFTEEDLRKKDTQ